MRRASIVFTILTLVALAGASPADAWTTPEPSEIERMQSAASTFSDFDYTIVALSNFRTSSRTVYAIADAALFDRWLEVQVWGSVIFEINDDGEWAVQSLWAREIRCSDTRNDAIPDLDAEWAGIFPSDYCSGGLPGQPTRKRLRGLQPRINRVNRGVARLNRALKRCPASVSCYRRARQRHYVRPMHSLRVWIYNLRSSVSHGFCRSEVQSLKNRVADYDYAVYAYFDAVARGDYFDAYDARSEIRKASRSARAAVRRVKSECKRP